MKTISQVQDEVAQKHGWKDFNKFLYYKWEDSGVIHQMIEEVTYEYAHECCEEQKKRCSEKAKTKKQMLPFNYVLETVDKESILSTPNVAEKPNNINKS